MPDSALHPPILAPAARPLRLAVVTETYPPEVNGVAMTVGRMVAWLRGRGHRVSLVRPRQAADGDPGRDETLRPGLPLPGYAGLRMGLPAGAALARLWRARRPDLVHVITEGPLGWSAVGAARALGLPLVSDFHTNFHRYSAHYGAGFLSRPIAAYLRALHNRGDCTLVPTRQLALELAGQGYRKLAVVARGVDTALFDPARRSAALRAAWGIDGDGPAVLHVGRVAAEKNLPLLLAAFDALRARSPGARLVLVGDGPARRGLARQRPDIHFAGTRVGEDLATHYASGDVFLFPSLTETFGNVTLEAMASGLPVLAFDYAAAAEHIRSGENGLLAPRDDAVAFLAGAARLADPILASRLGAEARRAALEVGWERVFQGLEERLLALAGRRA